jgi:UDP-N-acetylmuramoyl-L-alanine---L-glutamate ligase
MKIDQLADRKILILGLGREGLSTLNFLKKHFPDQKFLVADQEKKEIDFTQVAGVYFGENYLEGLTDADIVILSPGISPFTLEIVNAKSEGVKFITATEIFFSNCQSQIIGVTGTKGKSTTSSLIYEILKKGGLKVELVGNLGIPALDLLDKAQSDTIFVFELSSYQLTDLKISPSIAVFTNIYPEHLDYHQNFENYLKAKSNITLHQSTEDYFIYNSDFPELDDLAKKTKAIKVPFSSESYLGNIDTSLLGDFNKLNVTAAMIVGQIMGLGNEIIDAAVKEFKSLPHRLEKVTEKNGITFYNDSLATIPQATIEALKTLDRVETLIAGGFDRGIDYSPLGSAISDSSIKNLILFPITGEKIWQAVSDAKKDNLPKKFEVSTMEEAVKVAFEETSSGKTCLLSPASSSFNMFKDYAERGEKFKEAIKNY